MSLTPISETLTTNKLKNISLVATDMDGTLTQKGKFTSQFLLALEQLAQAKIKVLLITGRSAGWVSGLKTYLPVVGAIAENGGLYYPSKQDTPEILISLGSIDEHRRKLQQTFQYLTSKFPQLRESADNRFRMTDLTFDVAGLTIEELETISKICHQQGWGFTYSNVQCHLKPLQQDKATGLQQVLRQHFPEIPTEQVMTVGDSPNDETMFDAGKFDFSVGVANLLHYTKQLNYLPTYVTSLAECEGFCELAKLLIQQRETSR
ncbi:HAD family hydrolase [Oscillatoria salina]|uniref:HAD family hydrolase n=1 Tax=Oscillatoria salina TaxID=331517 RepID=UPI0013BBE57C|nr:HAD family hydrolase [Oscillatoria salina]MBZ8183164.1 HAD family phosphatase [Oscillatoria salina IIICB1]NET90933.1 HAD family phosphatase [Kamptonema sp. SIO1D9]